MMKDIRQKGRDSFTTLSAVLALSLLLFIIPAFGLTSCQREAPDDLVLKEKDSLMIKIKLKSPEKKNLRSIDVFFFNNDELKRLDSYQRFQAPVDGILDLASRKGEKIIAILANCSADRFTWAGINSYESLKSAIKELKDENPESPAMSGECRLKTMDKGEISLDIEALMAEIELQSLGFDFSSIPQGSVKVTEVKAYITNVNASSPLLYEDTFSVGSIINYGRAVPSEYENFLHPEIIFKSIADDVGDGLILPKARFYCYENESEQIDLGRPGTRLVIEAKLNGKKYYYPIEVNREGFGLAGGKPGIKRNKRYVYNIIISRFGTKDPDIPAKSETMNIDLKIEDWRSIDEEIISY